LEKQRNQIFVLPIEKIMGGHKTGGLEQNWEACAPPRPGPKTAIAHLQTTLNRRRSPTKVA